MFFEYPYNTTVYQYHAIIRTYKNENSNCSHVPGIHICNTCKQKIYVQCKNCVQKLTEMAFGCRICQFDASRRSIVGGDSAVGDQICLIGSETDKNIQITENGNETVPASSLKKQSVPENNTMHAEIKTETFDNSNQIHNSSTELNNTIITEISVKDLIEFEMKKWLKNEKGRISYQCMYCSCTYLWECSLLKHKLENHLVYKICNKCNRKFVSEELLNAHKDNHNYTKFLGVLSCPVEKCHYYAVNYELLEKHNRAVHIGFAHKQIKKCSISKWYGNNTVAHSKSKFCNICGRFFPYGKSFNHHNLVDHDMNSYYICPICYKICSTKCIKVHLLRHAQIYLKFG